MTKETAIDEIASTNNYCSLFRTQSFTRQQTLSRLNISQTIDIGLKWDDW